MILALKTPKVSLKCPHCKKSIFLNEIYFEEYPGKRVKTTGPHCPECKGLVEVWMIPNIKDDGIQYSINKKE